MRILGIETSCDDTGVAIYDSDKGLMAHLRASQYDTHAPFQGVVPELAARDHIRKLQPLVMQCLKLAQCDKRTLDGVAYTSGPGLSGALLVGAAWGRSFAMGLDIPAIGVHHMEGHLLASQLEENPPQAPFTALLVSGGHTLLVAVEAFGDYTILGTTLDDAIGEAFDKTAKLMGLGYPGGPAIAQLAKKGDRNAYTFPQPMINRPGLDFSFSGLKTFVRNTYEASDQSEQTKANISATFEKTVSENLMRKCLRALKQTSHKTLVIAGGVSANEYLREAMQACANKNHFNVVFPRQEFSTDNGAMIAYAGWLRMTHGEKNNLSFGVKARWSLEDLTVIK